MHRGKRDYKIKDIPKGTSLKGRILNQERDTNVETLFNTDKQIIVPSFGTVGALFSKHYHILEQLRRRIELLRRAKVNQLDYDRCWIQIEEIIRVLDKGTHFLNFNHEPPVSKDPTPQPEVMQQQ